MATPDQIPSDLTLEIGESLSPDRFLSAARAFFGYVEEVSRAVAPLGEEPEWVVRVREGSSLIGVEPVASVPVELVARVYNKAERGIQQLAAGDIEDAGLTESALKFLRTLSDLTEGSRSKPVPIRVWVRREPTTVGSEIGRAIREDWKADYSDYGTVEGRLEAIQDSGNLQLRVRDAMLRQTVRCYVPEDLLSDALGHFRKRVEVSGVIHYRRSGVPVSIRVSKIDPLPSDDELPGIDAVRGILKLSA